MSHTLLSVSALNTQIKSLLEATFMHVQVEGEVATVTYHASGHLYFSIKDNKSTLRCVMWRSGVARMRFRIETGMHIILHGSINVYVARGDYQLQAASIEPYGQGALALAFEQLKRDLQAKGYFDPESKKRLPAFPRALALVTAEGGAALQDMLTVARKRWPLVEIIVIDVRVQGEHAAGEIARGIAYADTLGVDIIVTGRGGGSLEDLWAFNELIVAEAIHAAHTPVVSAVGHEVDTLISDLVADQRAPTPSAAMEMILPDRYEVLRMLEEMRQQIHRRMQGELERLESMLRSLREHLEHRSPLNRLEQGERLVAQWRESLDRAIAYRIERYAAQLQPCPGRYREAIALQLHRHQSQLDALTQRLHLLNPAKRTREGYAEIIRHGKRTSLRDLRASERITLSDGICSLKVKTLEACDPHT